MKSKLFFSEIYPGQEKNFQNDSFYDLSSFQYESLRQEIINYIYFRDRNMSIQEMERKKIMIEFFGEFCFSHKPMINALADYPYTELLHDFKNWCTETQISKLNYKYRRKGYKDLVDCNIVLENFKDIIRYSFKHDMRVEIEKARWDIRKLELPYQSEKIPKNFIVNFSKITQLQIHCAMKRAVLLWIRYLSLSTVQQRVWAMTKFSLYLFEFYPDVQTIYQLDRDIIEEYLIYRKTESKKQKNLTEELKGLKAAFEEFSKIYEDKQFTIDEVFMDVTDYLAMYQMSAKELSVRIMGDILEHTGITATAGIGTNLYLAKVALDITAKHVEDHIGILDEESYCKTLWNHKPLTDFWRIGKGIAKRLEQSGIRTMGEIAHADEDMLYRMFGVDAELLIDHAWGRESTTMQDIKSYRPKTNSLSSGQVLECDYTFEKGKLVVKEMADLLCLELVEKGLVTDSITLHVGYSNRLEKKPAHGTIGLRNSTSSARQIIAATEKLYCQIVDPYTSVRRMTVTFNQVVDEQYQQYDLFTDPAELEREHRMQEAILDIKEKFGKNAILKGMDLQAGATTMERNRQIGGHKSGT